MDLDWIREYCLALPHTTEKVQWGDDLVFKVGEKMYAVVALEPGDQWLGFKCTPEDFARLVERPGIIPAPYLARAHWVSLETSDALSRSEVERLLSQAYWLIFAKLPKKVQERLSSDKKSREISPRRKSARNTPRRRKSSPRSIFSKGR
jgi:predicted DNA-binding protein (MmcQ/YjbR family)